MTSYEDLVLVIRRVEKLERQIKYVARALGLDIGAEEELGWKPHGPIRLNLNAQIVERKEESDDLEK